MSFGMAAREVSAPACPALDVLEPGPHECGILVDAGNREAGECRGTLLSKDLKAGSSPALATPRRRGLSRRGRTGLRRADACLSSEACRDATGRVVECRTRTPRSGQDARSRFGRAR